jgi:hypothetical protein
MKCVKARRALLSRNLYPVHNWVTSVLPKHVDAVGGHMLERKAGGILRKYLVKTLSDTVG